MKNLFVLFVILTMLSGCAFHTNRPATGSITYGHTVSDSVPKEDPAPAEEAPKTEPNTKKKTVIGSGMSEPVAVLVALGAATTLVSLSSTWYGDGPDEDLMYFTLTTAGIGMVFFGAAGIVYLAED